MTLHNVQFTKSVLKAVVLISFLVLTSGCAAFKGNQLPPIDPTTSYSTEKPTPISFKFDWTQNGKPAKSMNSENFIREQREAAKKILVESSLFEIIENTDSAQPADYTLHYSVDNHGNQALAALSGFISGFTFLVIPGSGTDHWTLSVELLDASGNLKWSNTYDDKMTLVTWLPLFPMMFSKDHQIQSSFESVLTNMYRHPVYDLNQKGILRRETAASIK